MTYAALTLAVALVVMQTRRVHRRDALLADLRRRMDAKDARLDEAATRWRWPRRKWRWGVGVGS